MEKKNIYFSKLKKLIRIFLLIGTFLIPFVYAFTLVYKKYHNYEYGKFDLGNMTQMVYSTLNGKFMVLTDQFGTNMPRWGMSHVDPVVLYSIPFYLIVKSPLTLVFIQHFVIMSAVFPLFFLVEKHTKSTVAAFLLIFAYVLYPANGYTLIWTGYHGISFVAPLLIWLVWFLDNNNYLNTNSDSNSTSLWYEKINPKLVFKNTKNSYSSNIKTIYYDCLPLLKKFIYWFLIFTMLIGKEEVGAMLFIFSIFLYFKNRKLAIQTATVSLVWFIFAFFIVIPHYSYLRQQSVNDFIVKTNVYDVDSNERVTADNFFFIRYAYLGDSYMEMLKTVLFSPKQVFNSLYTQEKIDTITYLLGPFGFLVVLGLFWVVSLPDLAITFLSAEPIFNIYNHRMAFVVATLFISQVILFAKFQHLIKMRTFRKVNVSKMFFVIYASIILLLSIWYSKQSENPLYLSAESFIHNKVIAHVFAGTSISDEGESNKMVIGNVKETSIPVNNRICLDTVTKTVYKLNPQIYTGPDYLGAQTSMREVNAVFPARYWDADMVVADIFEAKTIRPFGIDDWTFNRNNFVEMYKMNKYSHLFSCGQVNVFVPGENRDTYKLVEKNKVRDPVSIRFGEVELFLKVNNMPENILIMETENENPIDFSIMVNSDSNWRDNVTFFTLENIDSGNKYSFIDYLSTMNLDLITDNREEYFYNEGYYVKPIPDLIKPGVYSVYWGIGDNEGAREVYLGNITFNAVSN